MGPVLAERVEGDGVALVRWTPDDAELLEATVARNLEHLRPRMPWIEREPLSISARRAMLQEWDGAWRAGGDVHFAMLDAGEVVGACGLHHRVGPGGLEIGYWVDADHQGRGLATKAAAALSDAAFAGNDVAFVVILHDQTNLASRRVPEKLGYRQVAARASERDQAPADTGVDVVWQVTRAQWRDRDQRS